jgi:D-alanyl-D-alanine carboxypeptidase (penicillin-binding protein 5/6)
MELRPIVRMILSAGLVLVSFSVTAGAARLRGHHHVAAAAPSPAAVPLSQIRVLGNRPAPFALDARAAMLVAVRSGAVLYAFNEHEKMEPASLTKLMTFYITLRGLQEGRLKLDTPIPISEKAWRLSLNRSVSRMFLQVGQTVPLKQLLYGLMVSSGNDAAVALAEYQAGSTEAFTEEMNKTAVELGLTETHFTNPDGLPAPDEYTTAADMVRLGEALITRFPQALEITATKEFTFDNIKQRNFNTLLFYDSRVDGLKTGHVEAAGYHLVATARTPDLELISAVLGTTSPEKRRMETEKLLDWAFRTYRSVNPDWRSAVPAQLPVYQGVSNSVAIAPLKPVYVTVARGDESKLTLAGSLRSRYLIAPVAKGARVGELTVMLNGAPEASYPLVTQESVAQGGFFKRMTDRLRELL